MHFANNQDRLDVAGVDFDFGTASHVLDLIRRWRKAGARRYIALGNPHSVMLCRRDPKVHRAIGGAALTLPDGVGIVLAAKVLGYGRRHRLTGPDLMLALCDLGRPYGLRHFFYGSCEVVVARLAARLATRFDGLQIAGAYCPPYSDGPRDEDENAVARINATRPDILWVGLGAPKQEMWMAAHLGRLGATAMIGVGAAFDFHSGNIPWAPRWVRKCGMEWAYRLILEPRRMWRRNLDSPLFLGVTVCQAVKQRVSYLVAPHRPAHPARLLVSGAAKQPFAASAARRESLRT